MGSRGFPRAAFGRQTFSYAKIFGLNFVAFMFREI